MRDIHSIVVHHSAGLRKQTFAELKADQEKNPRVGNRLAYHYVIDDTPWLHRGVPLDRIGTHAKGANQGSIGICVIGDNTQPEQAWTTPQRILLIKQIRALRQVFGQLDVVRHCETGVSATLCPGLSDAAWHALVTPILFRAGG